MPISDKKRSGVLLAGAILMLLGSVFQMYRYFFIPESDWTRMVMAICWLPPGVLFYLQSRNIIKSA